MVVDQVLRTDRLELVPLIENNFDFFVSMKTDPEIMRYTPPTLTEEFVRSDKVQRLADAIWDGCTGEWVINLQKTGQPIGSMGIFELPQSNPDIEPVIQTGEIELGYRSIVDAWGKGYITEAASAVLGFAFLNGELSKLAACTHPDNEGSMNVLRKVGFRDCAQRLCYGEMLPYFELTRADWASLREIK